MNQTQSQTSSPTTDKYRAGLAKGVWKKDGNEGEAPIPTDAEFLSVSPDHFHLDAPGFVDMLRFHSNFCAAVDLSIREGGWIGMDDKIVSFKKQWEDGIVLQIFSLFTGMLRHAAASKTVPDDIVEIYKHLQFTWEAASGIINIVNPHSDRKIPPLPHPLGNAMRAWQKEQIPKVEPERRKDTGILHHSLRRSAPSPRLKLEVVEELPAGFEQMTLFNNLPQGSLQLELPGFVFSESEIVPALPLVAYENAGGRSRQSGRGAPIEQRLFVNVLIEYEQRLRSMFNTSRLNTTYRDVKSWLYPTGTKEPRKTLIPKLYKGMWHLHNLRFVWDRREWNIISVDSLPTMAIQPDDSLTFTVRMPDGMNTKNGALIGIEPLRLYGAQSAPKFRAWVRLAYLWDAAKIRNGGKRIFATIPKVLRNSDSYLVDAKGEVILTSELYHTKAGWKSRNGSQPQMAWYHPLAIKTGEQARNPQANKVPVLSDSDMVKLFYDHTERKGTNFTSCLQLARKHALEMQDDGRVVVETNQVNEKTGIKGWRILEPHKV